MNNYNNTNSSRFGSSQGGQRRDSRGSGRPRFGSQNSGQNQMHDAVCAACGDNCRVPFMPTSGKPVYCSSCFETQPIDGGNSRKPHFSETRSFSDKKSFAPRTTRPPENFSKQFDAINSKLDAILSMLSPEDK